MATKYCFLCTGLTSAHIGHVGAVYTLQIIWDKIRPTLRANFSYKLIHKTFGSADMCTIK